jgi:hypothetical protein
MAFPRKFDHDEARRRHAVGESVASIARSCGVSHGAVACVVDPAKNARRRERSKRWMHENYRVRCAGGCGTVVWKAPDRSGYCIPCAGELRRTAEHGTESKYSQGCRCDECRVASVAARRARRAANREATRAYDRAYKQRTRIAA